MRNDSLFPAGIVDKTCYEYTQLWKSVLNFEKRARNQIWNYHAGHCFSQHATNEDLLRWRTLHVWSGAWLKLFPLTFVLPLLNPSISIPEVGSRDQGAPAANDRMDQQAGLTVGSLTSISCNQAARARQSFYSSSNLILTFVAVKRCHNRLDRWQCYFPHGA